MKKNLQQSDKFYWHQYINFYEKYFKNRKIFNIAEIGILDGLSIKWLMDRFPDSNIYGADIILQKSSWPVSDRISYFEVDQGQPKQLADFFSIAVWDLIIEDGSHDPQHQVNSLLAGMRCLAKDGIYVLEDIHTSLNQCQGNALTVLLAIDHYKKLNQDIDFDIALLISRNSLLNPQEIFYLSKIISDVEIYRRTSLPLMCYNCGSREYNYSSLKCLCGVDIFSPYDSMTCVITKSHI